MSSGTGIFRGNTPKEKRGAKATHDNDGTRTKRPGRIPEHGTQSPSARPIAPATPEQAWECLRAAGIDVMLPGAVRVNYGADAPEILRAPVEGLTTAEYLGAVLAWLDSDPLAAHSETARISKALGTAAGALKACRKAWTQRCDKLRQMADEGDADRSPVLWDEGKREALRAGARPAAAPIIAMTDPLGGARALAAEKFGLTGGEAVFNGALLAAYSIMLRIPVTALVRGGSSDGKSFATECALAFIPPEEMLRATGMSARALIGHPKDLRHRLLYLPDANATLHAGDDKDPNTGAVLLRSMISENRLEYHRSEQVDGEWTVVTLRKEGPIGAVICSSTQKLDYDTMTRLVALHADGSAEQTDAILESMAMRAEAGEEDRAPLHAATTDSEIMAALRPWHAYFYYVASFGIAQVAIPFARAMRSQFSSADSRVRRDLRNAFALVRASAVLHRPHRETDVKGRLVAQIEDYAIARELLLPTVSASTPDDPAAVQRLMSVLRGLAHLARADALTRACEAFTPLAVEEHLRAMPATDDERGLLVASALASVRARLSAETSPAECRGPSAPVMPGRIETRGAAAVAVAVAVSRWPIGHPVVVSKRTLAAAAAATGGCLSPNTARWYLDQAVGLDLVARLADSGAFSGHPAAGRYQLTRDPDTVPSAQSVLPTAEELARMQTTNHIEW